MMAETDSSGKQIGASACSIPNWIMLVNIDTLVTVAQVLTQPQLIKYDGTCFAAMNTPTMTKRGNGKTFA
jgi:hypothetical protein